MNWLLLVPCAIALLLVGRSWFFAVAALAFLCAFLLLPVSAFAADCTGVTAGASADCPVYVNLLGPLGPASAASAPGVVDGPTARYSFMWGFGAVMGMGFLGFAVAAGVSVIRKG